jgi:tetratricopeptide (TPR) repeat protein
LKRDEKAESFWAGDPAISNTQPDLLGIKYLPRKQAPPTESQFMSILNDQGIETAIELYRKFKPDYPDHIFFREGAINIMGYRYLQSGRIPEALSLFELNTDAYPHSANVWDSYGEACLATGNYTTALENYKKALEILPLDTTTPRELKTAIENGAPQQIQRIEELIKQSESGENE